MSLTQFLDLPAVRQKFSEEFVLPKAQLSGTLKAPPMTAHYSLVGTAFDYLMRFYLQRLNPNSVVSNWVAEYAVALLKPDKRLYLKATGILDNARKGYIKYLKSGSINEEIIKSSLLLAQLDPIYRAGYIDPKLGTIESKDVLDLKNLISIVDSKFFRAKERRILNPTFEEASTLVGGADADLLIDNMLIDIKTVKDLKFTRKYYYQLIGYYILLKIGKVKGLDSSKQITKIGIYYSRYGIAHIIPNSSIEENPHLSDFVQWLKDTAKKVYSTINLKY
jgi:hypothetical protein